MRILYGMIMVGALVGLVWGVSAQSKSSDLLGDWQGYNHPCTPCLISITDIKEDGQLVLRFEIATDRTEAWGRVTHEDKQPGVKITTAGGHQLDLELSKNGKRLQGIFTYQGRPERGTMISLDRVPPQK
jgi:hypothetical protein